MASTDIWRSELPEPTPEDLRALRGDRTLAEMADIAGLGHGPRWAEYENGTRRPSWHAYEWLLLRLDKHPRVRLVKRAKATA